jgi:hypothetical protein
MHTALYLAEIAFLSWVCLAMLFCVALLRAAARRRPSMIEQPGLQLETPVEPVLAADLESPTPLPAAPSPYIPGSPLRRLEAHTLTLSLQPGRVLLGYELPAPVPETCPVEPGIAG